MCPIAANMHEEDLREALRSKDQSTNGTREELEQRLIEADLSTYCHSNVFIDSLCVLNA